MGNCIKAIEFVLDDAEQFIKKGSVFSTGRTWAINYHRDVTYLLLLVKRLVDPFVLDREEEVYEREDGEETKAATYQGQ